MASQLAFDQWQSTAGVVRNTVIQTVQFHYPDRWTQAAADGTTWYDTPIVATITPRFANSKIIGTFTGSVGTGYWEVQGRIIRNGTTLVGIGDAASNRSRAGFNTIQWTYNNVSDQEIYSIAYNFMDTPNSTSAVTYRLQLNAYSTFTMSLNGSLYDGDTLDYMGCPTSQLTLMEITQ